MEKLKKIERVIFKQRGLYEQIVQSDWSSVYKNLAKIKCFYKSYDC